ncbi:uncharacterized protein EV154DRAFT_188194, partial [Mucor mucedo]|uniref:uncharacterized protein n=1 Tax=Mucor mucedo TaxID=29922 RepID=UPI00221F9F1B
KKKIFSGVGPRLRRGASEGGERERKRDRDFFFFYPLTHNMSFSREGWKSQKALAQVCRQCLFKGMAASTPVVLMRRASTGNVRMEETPGLLEKFRQQLYQPTKNNNNIPAHYSARVKKAMTRRQVRHALSSMYQTAKKQNPLFLSQLSRQEFDLFLAQFISNPDDPTTNPPMLEALEILSDYKHNGNTTLKRDDYELMIYLATELKLTNRAIDLLEEATSLHHHSLHSSSYEAVIHLLSTQNKKQSMHHWLLAYAAPPTFAMVRSVVLSKLNDLEEAADYLRQHHPTHPLADLVVKHTTDSRQLLDHALDLFAIDSIHHWRLNDTLSIYRKKRQAGLSTSMIVKHLVTKSLYTGQYHTAEKLLTETLERKDASNVLHVANKIMHWHILQSNIKAAVHIWQQLESHHYTLDKPIMEELILAAARLKYHVDTNKV